MNKSMIFYEFFVNMNNADEKKSLFFKALYFSESEQICCASYYFIKLAICPAK